VSPLQRQQSQDPSVSREFKVKFFDEEAEVFRDENVLLVDFGRSPALQQRHCHILRVLAPAQVLLRLHFFGQSQSADYHSLSLCRFDIFFDLLLAFIFLQQTDSQEFRQLKVLQ
jgi:hypothetical protein